MIIRIVLENPDTYEKEEVSVDIEKYIQAKTADLKEFGYGSLTEEQTRKSLMKIINKENYSSDIIAMFMEDDFVKVEEE